MHPMLLHIVVHGAAVSIGEQLPEDGLIRPKHVAIRCDFNDILKSMRDCERFVLH
jgi:hypothetical protein